MTTETPPAKAAGLRRRIAELEAQLATEAGVRRRFAPHQLRHAHAVDLAREGVAVNIIQRQLGHRSGYHLARTASATRRPASRDSP